MVSDKNNPNKRSNSDVLKPYFNGVDLTTRNRGVWIIDFELMPMEDASQYEKPFEHIKSVVKPIRQTNNRKAYRDRWWLHAGPRPAMRAALRPLKHYIGTSMVAKHRMFSWLPSDVLPANLVIVIAREDDYFFGVLHSHLHELWARKMGTQLREAESGLRYTPTTIFETFPFPWPPGKEPQDSPHVQAIAAAARELVEKRDAWLNPPGHRSRTKKAHPHQPLQPAPHLARPRPPKTRRRRLRRLRLARRSHH